MNPHQTTLLKLIDSYLMGPSSSSGLREGTDATLQDVDVSRQISEALLGKLLELIRCANLSIRRSLGQPDAASADTDLASPIEGSFGEDAAHALQNLDILLPRVCEATVLVVQCFCSMALDQNEAGEVSEYAQRTKQLLVEAFSSTGDGLIEELIGERLNDLLMLVSSRFQSTKHDPNQPSVGLTYSPRIQVS